MKKDKHKSETETESKENLDHKSNNANTYYQSWNNYYRQQPHNYQYQPYQHSQNYYYGGYSPHRQYDLQTLALKAAKCFHAMYG